MDIPSVGAHCALPSCNVNDFLPIKCSCEQVFCRAHISPDLHACPSLDAHSNLQPDSSPDPSKRLQRCAFETCNKPSLESFLSSETREDSSSRSPAVCSRCSKAFCVTHREPNSHACSTPDLPSTTRKKNDAAQALLAKHFPPAARTSSSSTPAVRPTKQPTNPKKAAQLRQVQLMKMRHRAQPVDPRDKDKPVPLEQKLYVLVRTEMSSEDKPFWFRKITIAGKALDLLSAQLNLSGTSTSVSPLSCSFHEDRTAEPDSSLSIWLLKQVRNLGF